MRIFLSLICLTLAGSIASAQNPGRSYPAIVMTPHDWLEAVRYDGETARDAARPGKMNKTVLLAIAGSARAHRARIAAWSPNPAKSDAYGICGDAVIALANVAINPADALHEYSRFERRCAEAIGKR
jgi:hypothetical protein